MITEDFQSLEVGEVLDLYTLDLGKLGGGTYYFTPSVDTADGVVTFQGQNYVPLDIVINGFETNGRGVLPRPTMRLSNTHRVLVALVQQFDDMVGAQVTRIRTLGKYLDDGTEPDPSAHFPIDRWIISQKSAMTKLYIEFTLAASIDVEGQKLPQRLILHNYCKRRYRSYDAVRDAFDYTKAECPYTDTRYFTQQNVSTIHLAEDVCSKTLTSCTLRFGIANIPFWGFPGAGRFNRGNG